MILKAILDLYLGTTVVSWCIVFSSGLVKYIKLEKEGYKFVSKEKPSFKSLMQSLLSVLLNYAIPVKGYIMSILFLVTKCDDIKAELLEKGMIYKDNDDQKHVNSKNAYDNKTKSNKQECENKIFQNIKLHDEMSIEEKLAYLQEERTLLLSQLAENNEQLSKEYASAKEQLAEEVAANKERLSRELDIARGQLAADKERLSREIDMAREQIARELTEAKEHLTREYTTYKDNQSTLGLKHK